MLCRRSASLMTMTAQVLRHGQEHFSQRAGLLFLPRLERRFSQLGDALDQARHFPPNVGQRLLALTSVSSSTSWRRPATMVSGPSAARPECSTTSYGAGSTPRPSPDTGPRGPRGHRDGPTGSAPGPHRDHKTKLRFSARRCCMFTDTVVLPTRRTESGTTLVVPQAVRPPRILSSIEKGEAHDIALQPLHQLGRRGHGAAGGQQVVHDQHLLPGWMASTCISNDSGCTPARIRCR